MTRCSALAVAVALVVSACAGGVTGSSTDPPRTSTTAGSPAVIGALPDGPSALDNMNHPAFPDPLVPPEDIISGGPPPDGIPAIDDPAFLEVEESLDLLPPEEPVVLVQVGDDVRAYPVRVLIWHEIVNDTVGGVPVAVTYCPLCNSAVAYRREIRGVVTTFGTSGRLYNSALVMYDRATESLWTHFDGRAVVGVLTGEVLDPIPAPLVSWDDFRRANPTGLVLDPARTGYVRDYGRNPYTGYDDPDAFPFLFFGTPDERAKAKQRVVGIALDGVSVAFPLDAVRGEGRANAINTTVGDRPVVVLWRAGQASALDDADLAQGKDVGTVGVFDPVVDGERLEFRAVDDGYVDLATGSTWNVLGEAVEGLLAGTRLDRIQHLDTFWFAWSSYQPDTELVDAPG